MVFARAETIFSLAKVIFAAAEFTFATAELTFAAAKVTFARAKLIFARAEVVSAQAKAALARAFFPGLKKNQQKRNFSCDVSPFFFINKCSNSLNFTLSQRSLKICRNSQI